VFTNVLNDNHNFQENPFIPAFVINFRNLSKKSLLGESAKNYQKMAEPNNLFLHILNPWVPWNIWHGENHHICKKWQNQCTLIWNLSSSEGGGIYSLFTLFNLILHCKKRLEIFPSPDRMSQTKLSLLRDNLIIPAQGGLG